MKKIIALLICINAVTISFAEKITVKNLQELRTADKRAKPGDQIILQNGEWKDVIIELKAKGTQQLPVTYRAETKGKVNITGYSQLKLGGDFIVVDGLLFTNGYSGEDAVIEFRVDKKNLANNCRVTNTVINDFNNPKRMDENHWILFYGKNNRLDHCSFLNKKNMGVLLAVILDDDRSRENRHSIDHNYFGIRPPLASNTGEMIRVGVSQHCEYNSFTQITSNFFEKCDGETEIISIKSGGNAVIDNVFKECQGGVVLRHGNGNTVAGNIFLGNDKEGTGGVRIINRGHWVYNNFFYKCRGIDFRSPMSVMNGVPNSPANRYVEVTDVLIASNTFWECTPISFCEGSDTERTVPPSRSFFINNYFKNTRDTSIYKVYDDISGITFLSNQVDGKIRQRLVKGFSAYKSATLTKSLNAVGDSVLIIAQADTSARVKPDAALTDLARVMKKADGIIQSAKNWYSNQINPPVLQSQKVNCQTADEMISALSNKYPGTLVITLTGTSYNFTTHVNINRNTVLRSANRKPVKFATTASDFLFQINAGYSLTLSNLDLDLSDVTSGKFITTDTSGGSGHSNFNLEACNINNFKGTLFHAAKSTLCDSVIITGCNFRGNKGTLFNFAEETDKKGYYNVEKLKFVKNVVINHEEQILTMLRGGNDESTMGPLLIFTGNVISDAKSAKPLISLTGTQHSLIEKNLFSNSNEGGELIKYEDFVRAAHVLGNNTFRNSGLVITNKFVQVKK